MERERQVHDVMLAFVTRLFNFHSHNVNLDIIRVFICQMMHKKIASTIILKFTLKQLLHFRYNHHLQGAYYSSLLKLLFLK